TRTVDPKSAAASPAGRQDGRGCGGAARSYTSARSLPMQSASAGSARTSASDRAANASSSRPTATRSRWTYSSMSTARTAGMRVAGWRRSHRWRSGRPASAGYPRTRHKSDPADVSNLASDESRRGGAKPAPIRLARSSPRCYAATSLCRNRVARTSRAETPGCRCGRDGTGGWTRSAPGEQVGRRRPGCAHLRREPEVSEDLPDDDLVLDGSHHAHAAATMGTGQHVHRERVAHEVWPRPPARRGRGGSSTATLVVGSPRAGLDDAGSLWRLPDGRSALHPERTAKAPVEVDQRRLVAPVGHVVLRAGAEAALDALAQPEVLGIDSVDGELEVGRPMAAGGLGHRRLRDVERQMDRAPIGPVAWKHPPHLEVIRLVDEDRVREEGVELDGVAGEIPLGPAAGPPALAGPPHPPP